MQEVSPAKKIKLSARDFLIGGGVVAFVTAVTYYFNSRRREVDLRFGAELDWLTEEVADEAITVAPDLPPPALLRELRALEAMERTSP